MQNLDNHRLRLEIRRREGMPPQPVPTNLDIFLNGQRVPHVREVHLSLVAGKINKCTMVFHPDDIAVDADVLVHLLSSEDSKRGEGA